MVVWCGDVFFVDMFCVFVVEGLYGFVVYVINYVVEVVGIICGVWVVDMCVICLELQLDYVDFVGDCIVLWQLMFWVWCWCLWIVMDGDDVLVMDIIGSVYLWGDEVGLMWQIEIDLLWFDLIVVLVIVFIYGVVWVFV